MRFFTFAVAVVVFANDPEDFAIFDGDFFDVLSVAVPVEAIVDLNNDVLYGPVEPTLTLNNDVFDVLFDWNKEDERPVVKKRRQSYPLSSMLTSPRTSAHVGKSSQPNAPSGLPSELARKSPQAPVTSAHPHASVTRAHAVKNTRPFVASPSSHSPLSNESKRKILLLLKEKPNATPRQVLENISLPASTGVMQVSRYIWRIKRLRKVSDCMMDILDRGCAGSGPEPLLMDIKENCKSADSVSLEDVNDWLRFVCEKPRPVGLTHDEFKEILEWKVQRLDTNHTS